MLCLQLKEKVRKIFGWSYWYYESGKLVQGSELDFNITVISHCHSTRRQKKWPVCKSKDQLTEVFTVKSKDSSVMAAIALETFNIEHICKSLTRLQGTIMQKTDKSALYRNWFYLFRKLWTIFIKVVLVRCN